jgi:hypothetical protein
MCFLRCMNCGFTSKMTTFFIVTAVKTSNLTQHSLIIDFRILIFPYLYVKRRREDPGPDGDKHSRNYLENATLSGLWEPTT